MRATHVVALCILLLSGELHLSRAMLADEKVARVEAKLVAKGDDYLVHVLPRQQPEGIPWGLRKQFGVPIHNAAVTHTSLATGEMQYLFISGIHTAHGAPMGLITTYQMEWRLLGMAVHNNRLLLLTWRSGVLSSTDGFDGGITGKGQYDLTMFDVRDGAKLSSITIHSDQPPNAPPAESYDAGPLVIEGNRITVFERILHIDDDKLRYK
jgi:hypothetical protein